MTVSIVYPWVEKGSARRHVQDKSVDPRPLVCIGVLNEHYLNVV